MDYREVLKAQTVLDRKYRIDRVIGAGGFGITYQAFDFGLAAPVAIKEYYPAQFGMRDSTLSLRPRTDGDRPFFDRLRASFLREARTLAQFDHPAIVRVLSVFETHGTAYMVMRFESGASLKVWLKELGRAPLQSELDRLLGPLLDAIQLMHMADFLHRDIAPDNIIVRADGTPVLLDFGASRRVVTDMSSTLTGVVKQGYSPQEQYSSDTRAQGPWTDIYSLGATLYLAVTGRVPTEATARMLEDGMMPAAEGARGNYRPAFLAAIDESMRLRPRERPQSVAAWGEMLFEGTDLVGYAEGDAFVEGGTGPGGIRVPATSPRSGPTGRSRPVGASAPRATALRDASLPRFASGTGPLIGPGAQSSPRSGPSVEVSAPEKEAYGATAPHELQAPMGTRAIDFALSTRGAIALGIGAMLLGGSMLLAFENPDRGAMAVSANLNASNAGTVSSSNRPDVERARLELERQAAAQRHQDDARKAAEAEARRQEAARQAEAARQQEQARQAAEAEAAARERVANAASAILAEETRQRPSRPANAHDQKAKDIPAHSIAFADPTRETGQFALRLAATNGAVLAGGANGRLKLWSSGSPELADFPAASDAAIMSLSVSDDGKRAVTGSLDGTLRIWDIQKRTLLQTIPGAGSPAVAVRYRSGTRVVALFANGSWSIVEPGSGDVLMGGAKPNSPGVTAAQFSDDGKTVFAALAGGADGNVIEGRVPSDGGVTRVVSRLVGHSGRINAVAVSGDGTIVASAGDDGTVRLWRVDGQSELHRLEPSNGGAVRSLAFSSTGALVAGAGDDGTVDVWATSDGSRVASYRGTDGALNAAVFNRDGTGVVATGTDGIIRQWVLPATFFFAPPVVGKPEPAVVVTPKPRIERPGRDERREARPQTPKREPRPERRQVRERRESSAPRATSGSGGGSSPTFRVPTF